LGCLGVPFPPKPLPGHAEASNDGPPSFLIPFFFFVGTFLIPPLGKMVARFRPGFTFFHKGTHLRNALLERFLGRRVSFSLSDGS